MNNQLPSETPVIEATNLAIGFDKTVLLSRLQFSVSMGDVVGIIGPNGAGKSTLLKTLAGIIPPAEGMFTLAPNTTIGYVPQHQIMDEVFPLTAMEVGLQGRLGNGTPLSRKSAKASLQQQLAEWGIENVHVPFHTLSGGQRQQVLIARALLRKPTLLLLDEPAAGLDPPSRQRLLSHLSKIGAQGNLAVMLIVHHLHHIEQYINKVMIMNRFTQHFETGSVSLLSDSSQAFLYGNSTDEPGIEPEKKSLSEGHTERRVTP